MRHHLTSVRVATIKKQEKTHCVKKKEKENTENTSFIRCWWECKLLTATMKNTTEALQIMKLA